VTTRAVGAWIKDRTTFLLIRMLKYGYYYYR